MVLGNAADGPADGAAPGNAPGPSTISVTANSIRVAALENVQHGERENAQVEPQRPVVDVVQIILYALAKVAAAAQVIDLRPSRDSRFYDVLLHVPWNLLTELRHELGAFRPWPDQRHVALEHVEKLRKLIEAVA